MSVVTILENQKEKLSHEIAQMEKYVSTGPSGSLQVYKDKNHTKWYLEITDDHGNRKRSYLPKNEISLAKDLALKTYYRHAITEKKSELSNIERFLKHSKPSFSDKFLDKEYFDAHSRGSLSTLDAVYEISFFAVTYSDGADPCVFNPKGRMPSEILAFLQKNAILYQKPESGRSLIALSTCTGDATTKRLLVFGTLK